MQLDQLLDSYRTDRGIRSVTHQRMCRTIAIYSQWLQHPATVRDLTRDACNAWLAWLIERYSPKSAREFRGDLLAIWRFAADRDLCEYPERVRLIRVPRPVPRAWTPDDVRQLLAACLSCRHGEYLRLLLDVAYQTGLRRGDLLRLDAADVAQDGTIRIVQHKTDDGHVVQLDVDTAALVRSRGGLQPPVGVRRIYRLLEQARRRAGLPCGAMQQMRRTGATQCEIQQPGSAQRYLGHATAGLAYRYYVDWSQVTRPVRPPRVG